VEPVADAHSAKEVQDGPSVLSGPGLRLTRWVATAIGLLRRRPDLSAVLDVTAANHARPRGETEFAEQAIDIDG